MGIDSVTGEVIVKGMEGEKSDKPSWVSHVFEQFVQDFKDGVDPRINIKRAIGVLESRRVDLEDLKINVSLSKDPAEYATNTVQKRVGLCFGAKKGDVIYYYKSDSNRTKKDTITTVPLRPEDISVAEYKKVLLARVKDALKIMGFGSAKSIESDIFNISCKIQKNLQCIERMTSEHENEEINGSAKAKVSQRFYVISGLMTARPRREAGYNQPSLQPKELKKQKWVQDQMEHPSTNTTQT
jgi:hypothetical protein